MSHEHPQIDTGPKPFWGSRYAIGFVVFALIAAYFLQSGHRAHFIGALPFLLLLACPLMHVFMHHGHGGGEAPEHKGGPGPDTAVAPKANRTADLP